MFSHCRFLLNKTIDVVLYVDRLDGYRVDNLDKQVIRALARSFGPNFWRIAIIALTHAQLSPPDGVDYTEFVNNRSAALRAAIRQEAGFKKSEGEVRKAPQMLVFVHKLAFIHKLDILCVPLGNFIN